VFRAVKKSLGFLFPDPKKPKASAARSQGDRQRDQRHWVEAATAYGQHLALYPNDFAIWVQLGHMQKEAGDFGAAELAYEKALNIDPDDADLLLNYGHFLKLTGDIEKAALIYRRSFQVDGNDAAMRELSALSRWPNGTTEGGNAGRLPTGADPAATAVFNSGFFDSRWYYERYPDLGSISNLLEHFAHSGMPEGRDPGPNFSSTLYRIFYAEHLEPGESAFAHYLRKGQSLGLRPMSANSYSSWLECFETLDEEDRAAILLHAAELGFRAVTIFQVMDVDACVYAENIIASWRAQLLPDWEAQIVFANNVEADDRAAVRTLVKSEPRIFIASDDLPTPLPDPTRDIVFVIGAARLALHATYLVRAEFAQTDADIAYGDHDEWYKTERRSPRFKPVFSPTLLDSEFYIGRLMAFRAGCLTSAQMSEFIQSLQGWSFDTLASLLREAPRDRVKHVPFILASHALGSDLPSFTPRKPDLPEKWPKVSILIPTRDKIDLVDDCVDSILKLSSYPRDLLEIVIVDNGSITREALAWFEEAQFRPGFKIIHAPVEFNFAHLNNLAAKAATGEIFIVLNNDTLVLASDWLERLVEHCLVPDVAAVGAKLLYPDGTIQHGGCNVGVAGLAAHRWKDRTVSDVADRDFTRELSAVTGACIGVRRDVFEKLGGLDETLKVAFNDIKFCLDAVAAGYRNIYVAQPLLYHLESKSRGFDVTKAQQQANLREAIYTRTAARPFFQNDPWYSPNLSHIGIDDLAYPPRRRVPWRQTASSRRRIMLVSTTHVIGSGVAVVLNEQAARFVAAGYEVLVAGPASERDWRYEGCKRITVSDPLAAANIAVREKIDLVIVHSPPFYSMVRYLGGASLVYFVDHGEPDPEFFPDADARVDVNWEKRFCLPMADRVFAISNTIRDQSLHPDVVVIRNGNSHLARWSEDKRVRRDVVRAERKWNDKFVILNICRFGSGERYYKGTDKYIEVMKELWFRYPDTNGKVVFAVSGKGSSADVDELAKAGLVAIANPTDDEIVDLQAAADLYMNFSKWEGYNLGIGQALAMGLPVIASDIEAHREFPITTTNDVRIAIDAIWNLFVSAQDENEGSRNAFIEDWNEPVGKLMGFIKADLRSDPNPEPAQKNNG